MELGAVLDDLRLKVSGLVRTASTHAQRGDWRAALQRCTEALALNPTPFDQAAVRAVRGYALVKGDQIAEGLSELREALDFYDRSQLRYTRGLFTLWLADGCVRQASFHEAASLANDVLSTARDLGYRHLEGVARRILGEALVTADLARAAEHLADAERLLAEMGARNELGKAWVARACLQPSAPDRELLERALELFQNLGTLDEPARVERLLRNDRK